MIMTLFSKLMKTSKIAASSAKEKVQIKYYEGKLKKINNSREKIDASNNFDMNSSEKELSSKIINIKEKEKETRSVLAKSLKKEVLESREERKKERKSLKAFEKIQKEFKELPIVTIVDDLAEGASGIEEMKSKIKLDQDNPYNWLALAEALKFYNKAFYIINGIKAPIDMIGSAIDVSVQYLSEYLEAAADNEKWTYERALAQAIYLGKKSKAKDAHTLIVIGRAEQLLGKSCKNTIKRLKHFESSEETFLNSLAEDSTIQQKAEVFYYLAELWKNRDNKRYIHYIGQSISFGFAPAEEDLNNFLNKTRENQFIAQMKISKGVLRITDFKYSYRKRTVEVAIDGAANMVRKQSRKLRATSERIFDSIANRVLK